MSKEIARIPYEEFATNLENVFERVAREKKAFVVEKSDGARAILKPAAARTARRPSSRVAATDEAFRAAFGAWKGIVEGESLKKHLAASRGSRRPPVRL